VVESVARRGENYVHKEHNKFVDDLVLVNLIFFESQNNSRFHLLCTSHHWHVGATPMA